MKILLTGGAGYIGSHTTVELIQAGHSVVVIDNLSNSSEDAIKRVEQITGTEIPFYKLDLRDDLSTVFNGHVFDACIHFAGLKAVGESVSLPLHYYDNNLISTLNLIKTLEVHNCKNIIFSSSATVYGTPAEIPITENCPKGTYTNPYGWTKWMIEQILTDLHIADSSWNIVILRYFNPVGAHQSGLIGESPKGIPNNLMPYISQVASGRLEKLHIFGNDYETPDGTGIRDYIHVVDLARGHVAALTALSLQNNEENEANEANKANTTNSEGLVIYNLGTGCGYSVLDMVHTFERVNGVRVPYVIEGRRAGDIGVCYSDPSKAVKQCGSLTGKPSMALRKCAAIAGIGRRITIQDNEARLQKKHRISSFIWTFCAIMHKIIQGGFFVMTKRILIFILCLAISSPVFAAPPNALILSNGNGMVVSTQPLADQAGQLMLDNGGNAVDAAVAVGYALAVVHPQAGNIGGGGFAIIHTADGKDYALDFREMAPAAATRDMYLDKDGNVIPLNSTRTYKAAGIPGTVAGMSAMLDRFGTKKLSEVMAPAISMAEKGYPISERQASVMASFHGKLSKFATGRKYFLHADGTDYKPGEIFVQSDLAETLKRIASEGPKGFYKGKTAELIEADMKANDGLITKEDLAKYEVKWREPSTATYRGYKIVSMCPPSSGGAIIAEILNVMENADMRTLWAASPAQAIHIMAEAMRQAYADRSEYMGDPDFVNVPVADLTSKEYAKKIFERINPNKATPSDNVRPGLTPLKEGTNTTHYSVVDKFGNAVAITYTINESWGSGAAVDGAGFLLNNEMDDFSVKPGVPNVYGLVGGDANAIEPYKRPLSSMSPSIVSKEGKTILVAGSPGGSRIITTTLEVISNVIDRQMSINAAVSSPRYHMQWLPDELRIEPENGLTNDDVAKLVGMGYKLSLQPFMGDVNAIMIDPETGEITGSHDTRVEF